MSVVKLPISFLAQVVKSPAVAIVLLYHIAAIVLRVVPKISSHVIPVTAVLIVAVLLIVTILLVVSIPGVSLVVISIVLVVETVVSLA